MLSINQQVLALRSSGGYSVLEGYSVVVVEGPDAKQFLQTRLSNDVSLVSLGCGQMTTLLDRKAHVIAYFSLHRLQEQTYWLVMESEQATAVLAELETYHFREKVQFKLLEDLRLFTVQGPKCSALLRKLDISSMDSLAEDLSIASISIDAQNVTVVRRSFTGEVGLLFTVGPVSKRVESVISQEAAALGMVPLTLEAMEVGRIEAGLLKFGVDFGIDELLPETGLENTAASYSKGCFQGQEVLARIRTYGVTKRGVIGLMFQAGFKESFSLASVCAVNGIDIGVLKSNCYSPTLERTIAIAFVNREYRLPGEQLTLQINGVTHEATAVLLPFVSSLQKRERARSLYDAGLKEFAEGSEQKASEQLREAIELDPHFADAYEALGVILSRSDEFDEAIRLMKELERLDPESIMAHSNLSVFYMQKGDKEAAEEEKAKAMSIRMSQLAKEMVSEKEAAEERQKKKDEAAERMDMFRQVLAIDADDFLANAGMGSAYVDLESFSEAVPYLTRALAARPNHTVAYVSLGQCYEHLGQNREAIDAYKKGLSVASQKGEITPMKELQSRLQRLGAAVG